MNLDSQQEAAIEAALNGYSIFITGGAGSGKSYVLKNTISLLRQKFAAKQKMVNSVYVTAPTGIAALNIKGMTLHSFSGLSPLEEKYNDVQAAARVRQSFHARRRWVTCQVLVIDEISQVSPSFFETLNFVASKIRPTSGKKTYFGGLQLIVCGDFCQLPPIRKSHTAGIKYVFETKIWKNIFDAPKRRGKIFFLQNNYRQQAGNGIKSAFRLALWNLRLGNHSNADIELFKLLEKDRIASEENMLLYTTNKSCEVVNKKRIDALEQVPNMQCITYEAIDWGEEPLLKYFIHGISARIKSKIRLCLRARVMLNVNLDVNKGLVNGATGKITSFRQCRDTGELYPVVHFDKCPIERMIQPHCYTLQRASTVICSRTQIPLQLSYALTVHKAQGLEFDELIVDLAQCRSLAQAYVAISRCKDPTKLSIRNLTLGKLEIDPKVCAFYSKLAPKLREVYNFNENHVLVEASQISQDYSQVSPPVKRTFSRIIPETPVARKHLRFKIND